MATFRSIVYEVEAPVAHITMNRPEKKNAINDEMFQEICSAMEAARAEPSVRVIHLKGTGGCFSAGQDLSGEGTDRLVTPPDPREKPTMRQIFYQEQEHFHRMLRIYDSYKPLVVEVEGYCLGMACEFVLMAHTTVAVEDAVFGEPAVRAGYSSPNPLWQYKVGIRKAQELLLTGRYIDGREAQRIGLVTLTTDRANFAETVAKTLAFVGNEQGLAGRDGNTTGIGGIHPNFSAPAFRRITMDASGLAAAWRFASGVYGLSCVQRYGFRPDEYMFFAAREQHGLKGAIRERDEGFCRYFPPPVPGKAEPGEEVR